MTPADVKQKTQGKKKPRRNPTKDSADVGVLEDGEKAVKGRKGRKKKVEKVESEEEKSTALD